MEPNFFNVTFKCESEIQSFCNGKTSEELREFLSYRPCPYVFWKDANHQTLVDLAIKNINVDDKNINIIENPPNEVIDYYVDHFRHYNENVSFWKVKNAILRYLKMRLEESVVCTDMDVNMIVNSNWKNHSLTDTAPRDEILTIIDTL